MADNADQISTIDAYRNISNEKPGSANSQPGEARATTDPAHVGGELIVGQIDQPIRGQAGWQGLGKGPDWSGALASGNGETCDEPGAGAVSSAGSWGMSELDTNAGHTVPMRNYSESV